MATLTKPSVMHPEYIVTNDDMIEFLNSVHGDAPHKAAAFKMIKNSSIDKRHLIMPLEQVLSLGDFGERGEIYGKEARIMSSHTARKAIENAGLLPKDISMVVVTSCTGFMMPSLTAHLINDLDLPNSTLQLPIAQMGCVAGASAINRAYEHCQLNSQNNALIVTLETSSLCFQKEAGRLQDFITDSLFGDGVAAVVMRGDDQKPGFKIADVRSHFMRNTEEYIMYSLSAGGFNFSLDKDVMYSIDKAAPHIGSFIRESFGGLANELDFYVFHTGGRRIQDEVEHCLELSPDKLQHSRACLRESGNTSSVAVIDVLNRHFPERSAGEKGVLATFGPGFTTEMAIGEWQ